MYYVISIFKITYTDSSDSSVSSVSRYKNLDLDKV